MALGYNLLWLHISVDVAKYRKRKIIRFQHAGRAKDKKARAAAEIQTKARNQILDHWWQHARGQTRGVDAGSHLNLNLMDLVLVLGRKL